MGMKQYDRHSRALIKSRRWQALRWQILERDGFVCVECGARGRLEVDHIKPVRTHPELSFDRGNLQSLCPGCHTRKTRVECGHSPTDPDRLKWRESVADLAAQSLSSKGKSHA